MTYLSMFIRNACERRLAKGDVMKLVYGERYSGIDSAIPQPVADRLGLSYGAENPRKNLFFYVWTYEKNRIFGELEYMPMAARERKVEILDYAARITVCYSVVTPKSAEMGDIAESGIEDEYVITADREEGENLLQNIMDDMRRCGAVYPSCTEYCNGVWYATEPAIEDYATAETVEHTYHINGLSDSASRCLYELIKYGK